MKRTPEEIKEGVHNAIVGKSGSWPKGNVMATRVSLGTLGFPVVYIAPEEESADGQISGRVNPRKTQVEILLPSKRIGVYYQEVQANRTLNLIPERSAEDGSIHFSGAVFTVGALPDGREGGLVVVAGQRNEVPVYNEVWGTIKQWEDKTSYKVRPLVFPVGWQDVTNGRLVAADFLYSSPDITAMLDKDPQVGFSVISALVKRLPVGAGGVRIGYHPKHNDNPVRVEEKDGEIVARFLYPDIPTLATRIKEGKLNPQVFLKECLSPRALLGVHDVIELSVKSDQAGEVGISLAIQRLDPTKPTKPTWVDSLPYLIPQLAAVGVDTDQFSAALIDTLTTPEGVGEIFASLKSEPEAVEQPRVAEIPVTWGLRTTSGKRDTSSAEPWRSRQDHRNQGEKLKKAPVLVRSRGSKWEKKEAIEAGKKKWVHRNGSAVHSRLST